jgi:hypothetical protein
MQLSPPLSHGEIERDRESEKEGEREKEGGRERER